MIEAESIPGAKNFWDEHCAMQDVCVLAEQSGSRTHFRSPRRRTHKPYYVRRQLDRLLDLLMNTSAFLTAAHARRLR